MKNIIPINYKIQFEPDLKKFICPGTEEIQIELKKPTNSITLNSIDINIKKCEVIHNNKTLLPKIKSSPKTEEIILSLPKKISGKTIIKIKFLSEINNNLRGLYKSTYRHKGKTKHLATTQFEAADARRTFPCFDEPEAKATFEISLLINSNLNAISNMNIKEKKKIRNKTLYTFSKNPKDVNLSRLFRSRRIRIYSH